MKVKCYRCKQMFSSGGAIRKSQGGYGNTERVWYCFPCHSETEKEREKRVWNVLLTILIIFGFLVFIALIGG